MPDNVVEEQYTKWIYPVPVDNLKESIDSGQYREGGDPHMTWPLYWPRKRALPENMNILIAGCGTNQAAYYAYRLPNCNVTGIDLSESSLENEERLKKQCSLDNLTLHKMDLTSVANLGQTYDFIVSTGVLHHLPEPLDGFKALKSVLRPEGAMNIMVYGTGLRLGVYLMQKFFKLCNFKQTPQDVVLAKKTIQLLKPDHVVKKYASVAYDLEYDAGYVDTFLHRQDRSFYIPEIMDVVHAAGLEFLGWQDELHYCLEGVVPAGHPLWTRLNKLDRLGQAHAYELLAQDKGTHSFALGHPEYAARCQISFENDDFLETSIIFKRDVKVQPPAQLGDGSPALLTRGKNTLKLDWRIFALMQDMVNGTPLRLALENCEQHGVKKMDVLPLIRGSFKTLFHLGLVFILLPED